jgi:hypothetical protein
MTKLQLIRQVRDVMAAQGMSRKSIERWLREVNGATPAVAREMCREWLGGGGQQPAGSCRGGGSPPAGDLTPRRPGAKDHKKTQKGQNKGKTPVSQKTDALCAPARPLARQSDGMDKGILGPDPEACTAETHEPCMSCEGLLECAFGGED